MRDAVWLGPLGPLGPGNQGAGRETHLKSRCCAILIYNVWLTVVHLGEELVTKRVLPVVHLFLPLHEPGRRVGRCKKQTKQMQCSAVQETEPLPAIHTRVRTHAHTRTRMRAHIRTHAHTHAHTHSLSRTRPRTRT